MLKNAFNAPEIAPQTAAVRVAISTHESHGKCQCKAHHNEMPQERVHQISGRALRACLKINVNDMQD